jgi:hypothetical protein
MMQPCGHIVIHMFAIVQQQASEPFIKATIALGTLV